MINGNLFPNDAKTLWSDNERELENLARYIIRASFSSERMIYIPASNLPEMPRSHEDHILYRGVVHY